MPSPIIQGCFASLGLPITATVEEVKSAYRALALKWHPDRHNSDKETAAKVFIEIHEAYTILRSMHKAGGVFDGEVPTPTDTPPETPAHPPTEPPPADPEDSTPPGSSASSNASTSPPHTPRSQPQDKTPGEDDFSSKPEHPFGGAEEPRPHWNDSGAKSEEEGVLSEVTEGIPLRPRTSAVNGPPPEWVFPLEVTLEELAQGSKQRYKILRRLLSGKKKRVVLEINICPGWKQGTRIKFPRSGNERPNKAPQDIVFVVEELPHERFLRVGSTLRGRMEMTLAQALAGEGGVYHITGIDGEKIAVPVPASPVKLGTETTVKGAGMPIRKDGQVVGRGDLVIEWDILFPERLLDSQVEALRTLLNQGGV